jgi:hypothetical protein
MASKGLMQPSTSNGSAWDTEVSGPVQIVHLCFPLCLFRPCSRHQADSPDGVNQVSLELFEAMSREFEDEISH